MDDDIVHGPAGPPRLADVMHWAVAEGYRDHPADDAVVAALPGAQVRPTHRHEGNSARASGPAKSQLTLVTPKSGSRLKGSRT